MAIKISETLRNARLNAVETTISAPPVLKFFYGTIPANCAAADANASPPATLGITGDWMAAAASGAKGIGGTWTVASAAGSASACTHWRLYASDGTTCHAQGTLTVTGGGGDMTIDSVTIAAGQSVTVTGFTLTDGNA